MRKAAQAWSRGGRAGRKGGAGIWPTLLLSLVLPLLLFPGVLLRGEVVSADDHLFVHQSWARADAPPLRHPHLSDPALQLEPLRNRALEALRQGRAPLWNPDIFAGAPLLADAQSAPASPTTLIRLLMPEDLAQNIGVAWVITWCSLGTGMLLLALGATPWGAALAAAAAGTGPFLGAWLLHPHAVSFAFLPWVLWGLERRRSGVVALAVLGLVAGGHPGTVGHALALAGLWWLLRRRDLAGLLGLVCGLLLSAPLWLPFAEQLQRSVTLQARRGSTLEPRQLLDLLWPGFLGHPARESWQGPGAWIDGQLHPGLAVMPLALLGLRRRLGRWLWLGWILALAASLWGLPGPGNHARLASEAAWLLAVAAGLGLPTGSRLGAAALAAVLATGLWARRDDQGTLPAAAHDPPPNAWVVQLGQELSCEPAQAGRCQRVLGLQHALQPDLGSRAGLRDLRGYDLPVSVDTERLMAALDPRLERPWFRVQALPSARVLDLAGVGAVLAPQPLPELRQDLVPWSGHDGVYLRPGTGPRAWLATAPQPASDAPSALATALRQADPWARPPVEGLSGDWPATGSSQVAAVQEQGGGELLLDVESRSAAVLVVADAWAPGWRAELDGAAVPLLRVAGVFRGVLVPAGGHQVRMHYRPAGWTWGLRLGGAGLLLLVGLGAWRRRAAQ